MAKDTDMDTDYGWTQIRDDRGHRSVTDGYDTNQGWIQISDGHRLKTEDTDQ